MGIITGSGAVVISNLNDMEPGAAVDGRTGVEATAMVARCAARAP
ncbi:hypothetical protein [Arthrobacter livingstonensis]|nr:hypothetical protein [Arthrobacter livingstonensis]